MREREGRLKTWRKRFFGVIIAIPRKYPEKPRSLPRY